MKEPLRERVVNFLRAHVMGRTLVAPPVTTLTDSDRITSAYEEDAGYGNLLTGERGFSFDLTTLSRGTRYVASRKQRGLAAEGSLNVVRVLRYEFTERASTGRLIGCARFISSTNRAPDPFEGALFLVQLSLGRSTLTLSEKMIGYVDFPTAVGGFVPGSIEGIYTFSTQRGRLSVRYEHERFEVNPSTLARKKTGDKIPAQTSHEIVFPNPDLRVA